MNGFWRLCGFIVYVVACLAILLIVTAAIVQTQGDTTARYIEQQRQETIREQARQETERVRSVEWNATLRTWGTWGGGALAVGIGCWAVVRWQEERSKRHIASVSAQERVILAYIAAYGGRAGEFDGVPGVFLDTSREFVPWQVARAELPVVRAQIAVNDYYDDDEC